MSILTSLGINYQDFPEHVEFGDGMFWETQSGEQETEKYFDGRTFRKEDPAKLLLKTVGLIFSGKFFFAASTACHTYSAAKEVQACGKDIFDRFRLSKEQDPKKGLYDFVCEQDPGVFEKSMETAVTAAKSLACLTPFLFAPNPLGFLGLDPLGFISMESTSATAVWMIFAAYSVYHPQFPRVALNSFESWLYGSKDLASDSEEEGSKPKGAWAQIISVAKGKTLISQYFGWELQASKQSSRREMPRSSREMDRPDTAKVVSAFETRRGNSDGVAMSPEPQLSVDESGGEACKLRHTPSMTPTVVRRGTFTVKSSGGTPAVVDRKSPDGGAVGSGEFGTLEAPGLPSETAQGDGKKEV